MILTKYGSYKKIHHRRRVRPWVKWGAAGLAVVIIGGTAIFVLHQRQTAATAASKTSSLASVSSSVPVSSSTPVSSPQSSSTATSSGKTASSDKQASSADFKYFDDAVFTGDSVTVDFINFPEMDNTKIVGSIGISAYRALTDHNAEINDNKSDKAWMPERIASYKPKKVYMMFGVNDLCWGKQMTESYFIKNYTKLVDEISSRCPGAKIYVQSILPITASKENKKNTPFDNARVDQFNTALKTLCTQKGLHYLDVASLMKGPDGKMPADISDDGIHLKYKQYKRWFNYLLANK